MTEKIKAFVIKTQDKKEKDKNILLFSIEHGKVWATLKGVKNPNAKFKLAQNPFCFGEFVLEEGKQGKIVTGFDCLENFHELSENIEKYFEATAILEILNVMEFSTKEERAKVFVLALKTFQHICFGKIKELYCLNKFLIELFKICGVPLYSEKCSVCGSISFDKLYINYLTGELVCANCKDFNCEELPNQVRVALKILTNTDFEKLGTIKLAGESEKALLKVLVKNFTSRFDTKLKFLGILS